MIDEECRNKNCLKRRGRNDVQNKKLEKKKKRMKRIHCIKLHAASSLTGKVSSISTQNTKDMTIHTDIGEMSD